MPITRCETHLALAQPGARRGRSGIAERGIAGGTRLSERPLGSKCRGNGGAGPAVGNDKIRSKSSSIDTKKAAHRSAPPFLLLMKIRGAVRWWPAVLSDPWSLRIQPPGDRK